MIEAIVFDMDGVLFDTQSLYVKCWKEAAEILGIKDITEPANACIGRNRSDTRTYLDTYYNGTFPFDRFQEVKMELFNKFLDENGVPLMKGTKEILEYLATTDIKVAIASSTARDRVLEHLKDTGLDHLIPTIIGGDMVVHSKPEPDIYLKACEVIGVDPSHAIGVEDSYNGIKAAQAAGMLTVMIPDMQPYTDEIGQLLYKKCNSLIDLMELIKEEKNGKCR